MRKLWFNVSGEEEVYMEEELAAIPKGDRIDKFDEEPGFVYKHSFGYDDLPDEVKWSEDAEHCEFLNTERESVKIEQNFTTTQQGIEKLNERLNLLDEIGEQEDCV
jgi:uncharacterized protein with von Willebrand factor type A (vWA) domain